MAIKSPLDKYNRTNLAFIAVSITVSLILSAFAELAIFKSFYFARFLVVAALLASFASLVKFRRYFVANLHKAFLLIAFVTGVSYTIILPQTLYSSPDDQIHFVRALVLSGDSVDASDAFRILESNEITKTVHTLSFADREEAYRAINAADQTDNTKTIILNDDAELYQRLAYLPYYLGFRIGDLLHLDFITTIMVAKLCNMLCYIMLLYFAVKVSQKHIRPIFFITGLLASSVYIASQFSADPTIISSLNLAVALFVRMLSQAKVNPKFLIAFVLVTIWGCLPKAIYCPLLLLPLFIPQKQFDHPKRALAIKIGLVILTLLVSATFILPALSGGMAPDIRGGNTSVSGQIHFLLSNPARIPVIAIRSTTESVASVFLTAQSFGGTGIPTEQYTTAFVGLVQIILFFSVIFSIKLDRHIVTPRIKICFALAFLVVVEAINASLYLTYSQVGAAYASGIQARYFFPLLPLFALALAPRGPKPQEHPYATTLVFASYLCLTATVAIYVVKYSFM